MSNKEKKQNNKKRIEDIINLDREKVKQTAQKSKKNINIVEDCEKFCNTYQNKDLKLYTTSELSAICDEGNGLLDTYFIMQSEIIDNKKIIFQLQYIIISANYILNVKEIENLKQETKSIKNKIEGTIHRAEKLEKEAKNTTEEVKHVKNDIKGIITTILGLVLAFSIIPTAITAVQRIDTNYILPFMLSIIAFGMIMIAFIYSIYQDRINKVSFFILILTILTTIALWANAIFGFINIKNINYKGNNIAVENEDD